MPDAPYCADCLAASRPEGPGTIRSNQGIGKTFYGRTATCDRCGSSIRTLWSIFLTVPILPRGSYRVIEFEEEAADGESVTAFLARRVPLNALQVLKTLALWYGAILVLGWLIANKPR
ncbi:MAG: hypothetical protein HY823_10040 [Acidobacteria bacterium]|nr:hypothetical protein [Acidobacteriota bacterium]